MREILDNAYNPAILASFGKDSLLVIKLALQAGFTGPIYHLGERLSETAKQAVVKHDLTVYAWPCMDRYLIPDGDELAQVSEFVFGNVVIPVVAPVVEGEHCDHGRYVPFMRKFNYEHDLTLTGYKSCDEISGLRMTFPRELDIGVTRLIHPLYDWADEQVIAALGQSVPDTNAVEYCTECLAIINSSNWDKDAALSAFRSRFNFH